MLQAVPPPSPLVVDLDGTLLRSDLLVESAVLFLRESPQHFWMPFLWLAQGKAVLKQRLAQATKIDVSSLPFSPEVLALIREARDAGRKVVLATASDQKLADAVAAQLGLFDEVLASDGTRNLSAERKRDVLIERFGEGGFDYVGNAHDDLPILAAARKGFLIDPQARVERRAKRLNTPLDVLNAGGEGRWITWLKALRLHQWLKNLLIFVPLLASHQITDPLLLWKGVLAFVFFGLCASSVYLLNDLFDLPEDRQHPVKRERPFASGRLSVKAGLVMVPVLLVSAFLGAVLLLPLEFVGILAMYYLLTLAYSLDLKRRMIVDVMTLAALYTIRVIAGGAAFGLILTFWILAFSMFVFLSLAMVKRYAELHAAAELGRLGQTPGRGYRPSDMSMVAVLGAVSGYLAVLVLALYIHDEGTVHLYAHPETIWLAVPLLLFWISRVWMLAHRGQMNEDPLLFAVRDRVSVVVGLLFALVFWSAI
jgi:4-hydroxybenzoate polyprenyltransferase